MRVASSLLVSFGLLMPIGLDGQVPVPITLTVSGGVAIPQGELADANGGLDGSAGPTFGASGRVEVTPTIGIFVSYRQARFGCGTCTAVGLEDEAVLEAIGGGVRVALPFEPRGFGTWVEGGLVQQTLGLSDGDRTFASDAALGFSLGGGLTVPLAGRFSVTPAIRYLNVPADFDFTALPDRELDAAGLILEVGLGLRL